MVVISDNSNCINWLINHLVQQFSIKDLGFLQHFLGIEVHKVGHSLFLSQHQYALDLLARADISACKPISTPMPCKGRHLSHNPELFSDPSKFRSLVGGLQYLTFTRPDIAYSVNHVCQFMQSPIVAHFQLVKWLLWYVQGTTHFGMKILAESTLDLYGFSNAN